MYVSSKDDMFVGSKDELHACIMLIKMVSAISLVCRPILWWFAEVHMLQLKYEYEVPQII